MTHSEDKVDNAEKLAPIEVVGARTHNLKGVSCQVPRARLTVVTGVSGSGKSSLAFDTLYAEGQRRFVESMSTYARQFLEKMQRPDVDTIHNLPPAIALEQKNHVTNARSTVGTATEVHDFLRLLFARAGTIVCPECDEEVRAETPQSAADALMELPEGKRLLVVAPAPIADPERLEETLAEMHRQGFSRALDASGERIDLADVTHKHLARDTRGDGMRLDLLADRIALKESARTRLAEALELAFRAGAGEARVRDADSSAEWVFSSRLACNSCGREFRRPEPALFSFASPLGACPTCQGFGRVTGIDYDKVIPDPSLTLDDRPIAPWNSPKNKRLYTKLRRRSPDLPWNKPLDQFNGEENEALYDLIHGFFDYLERKKYRVQSRVMIARYRAYNTCPDCGGARLVPDALAVRVDGRTIADLAVMPIGELRPYFDDLTLPRRRHEAVARVLDEIRSRLRFLDTVGLSYLTLQRQTRTLSGGESQRINLATALGSALTDTLYVLDEPTVGLHSRDTFRLLRVLHALREEGNTVVVVEHDPDIILGADSVIDMGPRAGDHGGEILYAGSLSGLARSRESITAKHLADTGAAPLPSRGRKPRGWIAIRGARENNLKDLTVRIPRGVLCCVTGVSGSGKSTLVHSILYAGFRRKRNAAPVDVGEFDAIDGTEALDDILLVDQTPLGRSTRSNPVTYVKAYDEIRKLFASTREAKREGIKPGDFSFNIAGGRCEVCQGAGVVTVDMHFLADVEVSCDTCDGKRFQNRILAIEVQGKNIDDVLEMTVEEAREFFADQPRILRGLQPLEDVGLGYIRLGQSTATLSGGEAQRLKLAGFLATNRWLRAGARQGGQEPPETVMVFDEPTTGLHAEDLERLAALLQHLVDRGVSVVVIEHNLDLIGHADWIVDLGPEGGDGGGEIVAEGPPARIMSEERSHTGRYLAMRFGDA